MRPLISGKAADGWAEAYAFKAKIEAAEAERNRPQPVITPILLIVFALSVYIVGLATGVLP